MMNIDRSEGAPCFNETSLFGEKTSTTSPTAGGDRDDQPTTGFAWLFTDEAEPAERPSQYAAPQLQAVPVLGGEPSAPGSRHKDSAVQSFVNWSLVGLLVIVAVFVTVDTVRRLT